MRNRRYSKAERERALTMVNQGSTYEDVRHEMGVPKSTLSLWVASCGKVADRSRQLAHLERARKAAVAAIQNKKSIRESAALQAAHDLGEALDTLNPAIGKTLLAMLYWAEGGKQIGNFKFTNTDSDLVLLFLTLLRTHYLIDEKRLRVALQIHAYHTEDETINFWSSKLQIPVTQFWKVYTKPRSGRRKEYRRNFHGICNIHYSSTAIQRELLAIGQVLSRKLAEK